MNDKENSIFFMKDVGEIIINIKDIAIKRGFKNPNQIVTKTGLHYKVIERYWTNQITKPDKQILAIFCYLFNCDISELIRYIPPKKEVHKSM